MGAPLASIATPVLGVQRTFNIAIFLAGLSTISFGYSTNSYWMFYLTNYIHISILLNYKYSASRFLDRINDHDLFIGLSFFLRIIESIGTSGVYASVYWFLGEEFPKNIGTVFVRKNRKSFNLWKIYAYYIKESFINT